MIFVDTGAWFASVMPSDRDHTVAAHWLNQNKSQLVTTDYVIDKTLTLLKARGQYGRVMALGEQFFRGALAEIYYLTESDILLAWQVFKQFSDKEWSFTDCTSKVVMEKLQVAQVFAFDHHFHQFGSIEVVP